MSSSDDERTSFWYSSVPAWMVIIGMTIIAAVAALSVYVVFVWPRRSQVRYFETFEAMVQRDRIRGDEKGLKRSAKDTGAGILYGGAEAMIVSLHEGGTRRKLPTYRDIEKAREAHGSAA